MKGQGESGELEGGAHLAMRRPGPLADWTLEIMSAGGSRDTATYQMMSEGDIRRFANQLGSIAPPYAAQHCEANWIQIRAHRSPHPK
jgi:hypothetical protein